MKYIPKYFKAYELVPNDIYAIHFENSFYYIDDRILWTLDSLRDYFKVSITVNNWKNWKPSMGDKYTQRGYRNDINTGAKYSQHRYGQAVDFSIKGITAEQFRQMVRDGKLDEQLKYINRIEDHISWIHLDVCGIPRSQGQKIEFINP